MEFIKVNRCANCGEWMRIKNYDESAADWPWVHINGQELCADGSGDRAEPDPFADIGLYDIERETVVSPKDMAAMS